MGGFVSMTVGARRSMTWTDEFTCTHGRANCSIRPARPRTGEPQRRQPRDARGGALLGAKSDIDSGRRRWQTAHDNSPTGCVRVVSKDARAHVELAQASRAAGPP